MRPDLKAIRARCDAATPGPWGYRNHEKRYLLDDTTDVVGEVNPGKTSAAITVFSVASGALEDADFLAHARADIPALLAYVEELESRVTYTVGETEWANRIAHAEQRFVDEYDRRKAAERVIDELEEQAQTCRKRLEQCERERDEALVLANAFNRALDNSVIKEKRALLAKAEAEQRADESIDNLLERLQGTVCAFKVNGEMVMVPGAEVARCLARFLCLIELA